MSYIGIMKVMVLILMFFSVSLEAQDTIYYNFVTQTKSMLVTDYMSKGLWVIREDSLINKERDFKLKYKVTRVSDNHHYYKYYGYYVDVIVMPGGSVLVWQSISTHTLYRNMGHRKYTRVQI